MIEHDCHPCPCTDEPQLVPRRTDGLSPAERRLMPLIANGYRNDEIAHILRLTDHTIKYHLTNIYPKLAVRNRVEAAVLWVREQEIPQAPDDSRREAGRGTEGGADGRALDTPDSKGIDYGDGGPTVCPNCLHAGGNPTSSGCDICND